MAQDLSANRLVSSTSRLKEDIVDVHCHVASLDYIPVSFIRGVAMNVSAALRAKGIDIPVGKILERSIARLQDPDCSQLLAEMAAADIRHSILLIADFTFVIAGSPLSIEEIFERHHALCRRHPSSLTAFGGVDPRWGTDGVDLFERSVREWGFRGFKVYPPCGFSPSDERLFAFYEICRDHGLPVLIHFGPTSPALSFEYSSPFTLDLAARTFPTVDFIIAHGAVNHVEESVMMCEYRPNVYMDLSGLQTRLGHESVVACHRHIFYRGLGHKILFGTDWPLFRLQGTQKDFLDELLTPGGLLAELEPGERRMILAANTRRLLGAVARQAGAPAETKGNPVERAAPLAEGAKLTMERD